MGPSHWVICRMCGMKFDFEKKGGYYDGSRYICKSCGKMVKKQLVNESLTSGAVNGSWFARNWKILFGIMFLIGGLGNIGEDWEAALFGILIGAALLFFQYYPQVKAKKQQKEKMESENRAIAEQVKFCKTCGARTKGLFCEYCGTKLD